VDGKTVSAGQKKLGGKWTILGESLWKVRKVREITAGKKKKVTLREGEEPQGVSGEFHAVEAVYA